MPKWLPVSCPTLTQTRAKKCPKIRREVSAERRQNDGVPSHPEFEIQTDGLPDLVRMRYLGHVTAAAAKACCDEVERVLPKTRPGYTVLTDLSGLESMDLDCVPHLTKIMDLGRAHGIGTVVRVIPDPSKDIGFNILSIIHFRRGVKIVTCETLAEAERVIQPRVK